MTSQLSPSAVKRLMRYQSKLEGAQNARDAAEQVCRALNEQYAEALRSACEDAQVELPPPGVQATVNVDWITGNVTVVPVSVELNNGVVESPYPTGSE